MPGPAQYDPQKLGISFMGSPIVGFDDGTFLEVERNEPAWKLTVGAGGESVRVRNQNNSAKIRFTLLATSPSNDMLSGAAEADRLTGTGIGTFMAKDILGRTLVLAPNTWVEKRAPIKYGKEHEPRVWELETDDVDDFIGGSP